MNTSIFLFFNGFAGQSPIIDSVIKFFADYLPYILVGVIIAKVILAGIARAEKIRWGIQLLLAGILSRGLVVEGIRFFYHHPRPFIALTNVNQLIQESGYSFPSGHATFFFAISAVVYNRNKKFGMALFVASFLIGLARIAAGVHYPYDILGGMILGTLVGFLSVALVKSKAESSPTSAASSKE